MKVKLMMATACLAVVYGGIAFAADWNFYGSARVETFWTDSDINDTTNLSESLQSNSRIGARVRASDELTGRFEYGASGGDANIRILYGEWDFGAGTLLVGQDWTPLYLPLSNQVYNTDNGLGGWGEASPGRHTMIRLKFDGFEIAAISPDNTYFKSNGDAVVDSSDISSGNTQTAFPRIEVSYKVDMDKLSLAVGGGYNTFEYNDDQDIDAYVGHSAQGRLLSASRALPAGMSGISYPPTPPETSWETAMPRLTATGSLIMMHWAVRWWLPSWSTSLSPLKPVLATWKRNMMMKVLRM